MSNTPFTKKSRSALLQISIIDLKFAVLFSTIEFSNVKTASDSTIRILIIGAFYPIQFLIIVCVKVAAFKSIRLMISNRKLLIFSKCKFSTEIFGFWNVKTERAASIFLANMFSITSCDTLIYAGLSQINLMIPSIFPSSISISFIYPSQVSHSTLTMNILIMILTVRDLIIKLLVSFRSIKS